ncbi:hypothetical protein AB0I93_05755 [Streptomyces sp. NPDC049967]|uniref:hypothetical protein n=1 Tax=Streptomyces sp. NPDC049967 TaxID=3155658 RepID=UPI00342F1101
MPPLQALVVDGRAALVVTESETGTRSSVLRIPEVLNTICSLFESVWSDADPAHRTIVFGDGERTALARRILGHLHAGVTDEGAARELTFSVRTYGRYVAEIMTLLGANSRFQMGVRAAKLGLIPTPPPRRPIDGEHHVRHPAGTGTGTGEEEATAAAFTQPGRTPRPAGARHRAGGSAERHAPPTR